LSPNFSAGRRADAEGIGGRGTTVRHFFVSPPFPKREEPRAQGLKRRGKRILAFPSRRRGHARVLSYERVAIFRGETEEESCPEEGIKNKLPGENGTSRKKKLQKTVAIVQDGTRNWSGESSEFL